MSGVHLHEREFTQTIYALIKEYRYEECIEMLENVILMYGKSRPALSLLAFSHYQLQDYVNAADCYEQLSLLCPEVDNYRLYYAQSLYKSNLFEEAMKVSSQIDNPEHLLSVYKLQASIKYHQNDISGAQSLVGKAAPDDPDALVNKGCILYKDGKWNEALQMFRNAERMHGTRPDVTYNIILCQYALKEYSVVIHSLSKIIANNTKEHPELAACSSSEGRTLHSVGNTLALQETTLIECINLLAATHYHSKSIQMARYALDDLPPRSEQELDPVTLHNIALVNMDIDPTQGFEKLQFLLLQKTFPPETFGNLLLLYIKYEYYNLAADVLAENADLTYKYLTPFVYSFIEAVIVRQTCPAEAYAKLEVMAVKLSEILRNGSSKAIGGTFGDSGTIGLIVQEYEETMTMFIPVLMQQCVIYWDMENYAQVEKILQRSVEFCMEDDTWKLSCAHVLFMQAKYKEAAEFYQSIFKRHYEQIFDVSAIVLANLCVSYIVIGRNEDAEELIMKILKDEQNLSYSDPTKKVFHRCIVNLVVGTFYCVRWNFEFGILHIVTTLAPYAKNLGTETWYYTKRCFLALFECIAKHMIIMPDTMQTVCLQFLNECEKHGRMVNARVESSGEKNFDQPGKNTVAYEARVLKALLMQMI